MKYFIFDLDETLYKQDENQKIIETIDKELLMKLKEKGTLIMFSNATYSHCDYWCSILNIKECFSSIISSNDLQHSKPNPLAYKKVMELCGINYTDEILFFDDLPINLYSAFQYNWKTFLINKNNNMENYNNNDINEDNTTNLYWLKEKYENINECILNLLELKKK